MSFKENFFFIKFALLFFIVTIFGYWGLDLNSEELYIAFSFFFLVVVLFRAVRKSMLLFFLTAVNRKYSRLLVDLNRIRLILSTRNILLKSYIIKVRSRKIKIVNFIKFITLHLQILLNLNARLNVIAARKFFFSLLVNLNFYVFDSVRVRRTLGFLESSLRVFSISIK